MNYAVVVLEDLESDAEMLIEQIKRIDASFSCRCVKNSDAMLAAVADGGNRVIVFADVRLDPSSSTDEAGLAAVAALAKVRPDVPYAIVTGYFQDFVCRLLTNTMGFRNAQCLDILDKGSYTSENVEMVILKAQDYYDYGDWDDSAPALHEPRKGNSLAHYIMQTSVNDLLPESFSPQSISDLIEIASSGQYLSETFDALIKLASGESLRDLRARRIFQVDSCWEIRAGRDHRVYFAMRDGKVHIERITGKNAQNQTIAWLRSN